MRKILFLGMFALVASLFTTSCDEDRDSNPVYRADSVLVLNVPGNAANNVYDLSNDTAKIVITTSQPNNGMPLAYAYNTLVSLDGTNFKQFGEAATTPSITLKAKDLNDKVIELNGDECPKDVVKLYVKVTCHLAVDATMGIAESNVIELNVRAYAPEVTVALPTKMYIVGSFAASNNWATFVPLHQAYSQDGFFFGMVHLQDGAEFKLSPKEGWGEDRGFDAVILDESITGNISQGDGTNMKIANGGWYTVVVKTKIAGDKVNYTLILSAPKLYLFGAANGGGWDYADENLFTVPADANGEFVSPAFAALGEIRIAFQTGIDWWKTELTLDGAGNIYYRDKDMPSNWADSFGAEYSQQAVPGKHIYLNFTTGTGHLE